MSGHKITAEAWKSGYIWYAWYAKVEDYILPIYHLNNIFSSKIALTNGLTVCNLLPKDIYQKYTLFFNAQPEFQIFYSVRFYLSFMILWGHLNPYFNVCLNNWKFLPVIKCIENEPNNCGCLKWGVQEGMHPPPHFTSEKSAPNLLPFILYTFSKRYSSYRFFYGSPCKQLLDIENQVC